MSIRLNKRTTKDGETTFLYMTWEQAKTFTEMYKNRDFNFFLDSKQTYELLYEIGKKMTEELFQEHIGVIELGKKNNAFALKFAELDEKNTTGEKDFKAYSNAFLEVIEETLEKTILQKTTLQEATENNNNVAKQFQDWVTEKNISTKLAELMKENPNILDELKKNDYSSQIAGEIGEIFFSLFLQTIKRDNDTVKVLGQTNYGTGQAAVDVKIDTKTTMGKFQSMGFQVKNYTSIQDTLFIYSQSNKLSDERHMLRYIEKSMYSILQNYFLKQNDDENKFFIFRKKIKDNKETIETVDEEEKISKTNNILIQSIPNYLRFDEATEQKQMDEKAQSNFYIINFNFIPASTIFIAMELALRYELQKNQQDLFFFTSEKQEKKVTTGVNLLSSWIPIREQMLSKENTKNIVSFLINNLYINFTGIDIHFKDNLSFAFKISPNRKF